MTTTIGFMAANRSLQAYPQGKTGAFEARWPEGGQSSYFVVLLPINMGKALKTALNILLPRIERQAVGMMGNRQTIKKEETKVVKPSKFRGIGKLLPLVPIVIASADKVLANNAFTKQKTAIEAKKHMDESTDFSKVKIKLQKQMRITDAFEKVETSKEVLSLKDDPETAGGDEK